MSKKSFYTGIIVFLLGVSNSINAQEDMLNKKQEKIVTIAAFEIGIYGNTHFPMSDLNNVEIADLLSDWLKKKKLD